MDIDQLIAELDSETDLLGLLQRLGEDCLSDRTAAKYDKYGMLSDRWPEGLQAVEDASYQMWLDDGSPTRGLDGQTEQSLRNLADTPALATLTALEGICRGRGRSFFAHTFSKLRIERGMVLPLPARHLEGWNATPHPGTTHWDLLEPESGFVIWDREWALELDYSLRAPLEAVCWVSIDGSHRLPHIATSHPFSGLTEMSLPDELADGRFFGVHPALTDGSDVDSNTQRVADAVAAAAQRAAVVVLPEFCLHDPDALKDWLGSAPEGDRPGLLVAGSAHTQSGDHRSNMSVAYLDGVELLRCAKHQPFRLKIKGEDGTSDIYVEDLTPHERVIRLAAGSHTRLAVAICSDLNADGFASTLAAAGVNLLLSPAWTPMEGTFGGAACELAAFSQCVSVIANTPGHPLVESVDFWAISVVPRAPVEIDRHTPADPSTTLGVLDPNAPRDSEDHWHWAV